MEKTLLAHGTDLAVAEETGQAERAEPLLDQLGVVVGSAKQVLTPSVAAAEAPAEERSVAQLRLGPCQQRFQVFGRRCR